MTKLSWNDFIAKHPRRYGVLAYFVPLKMTSTKNGKRITKKVSRPTLQSGAIMPTPYMTVGALVRQIAKGDWASKSDKDAVVVMFADKLDGDQFRKALPAASPWKTSDGRPYTETSGSTVELEQHFKLAAKLKLVPAI